MIAKLPEPSFDSGISLERCLAGRRSVRNFIKATLSLREVAQLLWAAQGITSPKGYRTAPSAGALYPLKIHAVVGWVEELDPGAYLYNPSAHELLRTVATDLRSALARAALGQGAVQCAAVNFVISAVFERTTGKYGQRGIQYVHLDAGHAAQNICLQAHALNLGTVPVGAFRDRDVAELLQLKADEIPLYILPVGKY